MTVPPLPPDLQEYSSGEFTPLERAAIRKQLSAMRFRTRFWSTVGVWVRWIFFVVGGILTIKILLSGGNK